MAMVVSEQVRFISQKDLGFDREGIVILPIFAMSSTLDKREERLAPDYERVKQTFLQNPAVEKASAFRFAPGVRPGMLRSWRTNESATPNWVYSQEVDEDFLDTFGLRLLKGRNLAPQSTWTQFEAVLNESAVRALGLKDPIGAEINVIRFDWTTGVVVGVVEDFQNRSLRNRVAPAILWNNKGQYAELALKVSDPNESTIAEFKKTWEKLLPSRPFTYSFFEERLEGTYGDELLAAKIITSFSFLAVLVSCLGLFSLALSESESRMKEIGIRKTLGCPVSTIVQVLLWRMLKLVFVSWAISVPFVLWIGRE